MVKENWKLGLKEQGLPTSLDPYMGKREQRKNEQVFIDLKFRNEYKIEEKEEYEYKMISVTPPVQPQKDVRHKSISELPMWARGAFQGTDALNTI